MSASEPRSAETFALPVPQACDHAAASARWKGCGSDGLSRRIATLFRAKANKALDRAEDPREMLDYSYERQLELLQQVRRGWRTSRPARRVELQLARSLPGGRDDLQSPLDALTAGHDVDDELGQDETQLPAPAPPAAIEGPGTASADLPSPPGRPPAS